MATLDILTTAEARKAVNAGTQADYDDRLTQMVTAVSLRVDELAGPVVQRTVTEYHNGGCVSLGLYQRPAASVTTLTEYDGTSSTVLTAETVGTAPADGYLLDTRLGMVYRRSGGYDAVFTRGRNNIVVVYVAGRAATTAAVDSRFKEAAAIILAHNWRTEKGSGNTTFGDSNEFSFSSFSIPNRAMELIGDQARVPGIA